MTLSYQSYFMQKPKVLGVIEHVYSINVQKECVLEGLFFIVLTHKQSNFIIKINDDFFTAASDNGCQSVSVDEK